MLDKADGTGASCNPPMLSASLSGMPSSHGQHFAAPRYGSVAGEAP